MDILDLLPREHVVAPLRAPDLRSAVVVLARRLHEAGKVEDIEAIERRIHDQPLREIAGLSGEVILPHYRSDAVTGLALALGVSPVPISAADDSGLAPRVVALLLAPLDAATRCLQITSTLARLFRQPGVIDDLAAQTDPDGVRSLDRLQNLRIQHDLLVRDVMRHRIHSVPPDFTVRRTLELMLRRNVHAVPVVGDKGEVLGMVTDSDMMRALLPQIPRAGETESDGEAPQERPVREIMTRSVLCVSEELGIGEVASMMINKDVEQLPVVNAGSIAGVIYRGDIIRKFFGRS